MNFNSQLPSRYMVWFMVWTNLTKSSTGGHLDETAGWFGVCLPIKTGGLRGLHRKSLEHDAGLMLQKQWMHFVF
jgi:hypothetical protein